MSDTTETILRLVDSENDAPDTLPFERRTSERRATSGRVTALRTDYNDPAAQNKIFSLQLIDMSDGGVGAVVSEPVAENTPIVIFFPPHGPERGFDLHGHVVRCQNTGGAHQLGIRFDGKLAA